MQNRHILITGTTSGIGLGILKHYHRQNWKITAINRRKSPELEKEFPGITFHTFDVRDLESVKKYFQTAAQSDQLPSLYFLGAGINKVDNVDGFSVEIFKKVMDVNLDGVLNFAGTALPYLKGREAVFVAASSTTNIFANPNCLGYQMSKLALYKIFKSMDKIYNPQGIRFKTLVLGPIATNIFVSGKLASKLQSKVREIITLTVDESIPPIVRFIHSNSNVFYYPKRACLLFCALRIVSAIFPGFYKGSAPPSAK